MVRVNHDQKIKLSVSVFERVPLPHVRISENSFGGQHSSKLETTCVESYAMSGDTLVTLKKCVCKFAPHEPLKSLFLLFNEKIQIIKFLPTFFVVIFNKSQ